MYRSWKFALVGSIVGASALPGSAPAAAARHGSAAEARHAWKARVHTASHAVSARSNPAGPIPAHFGSLAPEVRLAYLLTRRDVDPARFDANHHVLGAYLANDERLRAIQAQTHQPVNGLFPDNAMTRHLHYLRDLNPVAFDRSHPTLGALLAEDDRLRAGLQTVASALIPPSLSPTIGVPSSGTDSGQGIGGSTPGVPGGGPGAAGGPGGGTTGGGGLTPIGLGAASVPEPASLALLAFGTVAASASGWRKRSRARRGSAA